MNEEILVPQGTPLRHLSFAKSLSNFFWQILEYDGEAKLQIELASLQIDVDIAMLLPFSKHFSLSDF